MTARGHVPDESLPEYRALKKALDAVDQAHHWYLTQGRNPPPEIGQAYGQLDHAAYSLRVPIAGR